MGPEPTDGDGMIFYALKGGQEIFRAYGSNNVLDNTIGSLYSQALTSASEDGFKLTYQKKSSNTYTISGTSNTSILYERTVFAPDASTSVTVSFRYPISEKQTWNSEVDKVIGSLHAYQAVTYTNSSSGFTFADLSGLEFIFTSGAGAWYTSVKIAPDGTFSGTYHDSDMGDTGSGYPKGTRYDCSFSGKFSALKKISDHEYSLRCESLSVAGKKNTVKIVDGIRTVNSAPAGIEANDSFLLYLPGRQIKGLPQDFLDWARGPRLGTDFSKLKTLDCFGLYDTVLKTGFTTGWK